MNQDDIKQLSPEILAKFVDWEKKFEQLSLAPWNNLEELKKLRDEIYLFIRTLPEYMMIEQFDFYIAEYSLAQELMSKILNCIIHQCKSMK